MPASGGTQLVLAPQAGAVSLTRLPPPPQRGRLWRLGRSTGSLPENLQRARVRPAAAAARKPPRGPAASASAPRPAAKHFLRPSLLATGLTEPADVLQHALALFRKADLAELAHYLPTPQTLAASPLPLPRQPLCLAEQGPLAPLAGLPLFSFHTDQKSGVSVLDVGAARVLPGHLLRRSRVLSTLQPSPDLFQQRTALTARSGETSVFDWVLRWHAVEEEAEGNGSSSHGNSRSSVISNESYSGSSPVAAGGGRWVIESVRRDASADMPLPTTPHPKAAPEAVLMAQLAALQAGNVFEASCFCMRAGGKHMSSRRTSLVAHHDALRSQLQLQPYHVLLNHAAAQLGPAALPTLRDMLQEVAVLSPDGASARFVWRLRLAPNGCWMTSGIFTDWPAAEEAAALAATQQEEQAQWAAENGPEAGQQQQQQQQQQREQE